jgi:hypothetical protein
MNNWFTVKVKYTKQLENGSFKRVTEPYLLAAMTFTDAEARIYEELGQIIRGEFNVVGIMRTEIHDIFYYEDADVWYKIKLSFLVTAHSVKEAYDRISESLSTLMVDFEIPMITVSPIVEVFPYQENLDKELSRTPMEDAQPEEEKTPKGKVFSAPGSDVDEDMEDEDENEIVDELEENED